MPQSHSGVAPSHQGKHVDVDVLIVGGGFGGVYGIHKFREMGLTVKLFEAGSYFGGTWHWNRYPGARVDSETPFYSLSIPAVWKTWNWSERFPAHDEIREYFKHVDKTLHLSKDAYFNTVVVRADYTADGHWNVGTKNGITARCKYLILATGSSYKHHVPHFAGLENYRGRLVHSTAYPREGLNVTGKRVAVIGNGASGVQLIQELAKEKCSLTAFIRTPNVALPMVQRKITDAEQDTAKAFYEYLFQVTKTTRAGFPYVLPEKTFLETPEKERLDRMEVAWGRGGFAFLQSTFRDFLTDKKVNAIYYDFWAAKVRSRIKDRSKADVVAPLKQNQWFGTKRPSLEQDYYESIDRDNVTLVDLNLTPIREFREEGIMTSKELLKFDIVVLATGFDAVTGSLLDMGLSDKNGVSLQEKWKEGVRTYLGLTVTGMPNMFMSYSPQSPTSFANGPPIIEIQINWIAEAIKKMKTEGISAMEPTSESAEEWRAAIQKMNHNTLYPLSNSWYMGANIPGKVREPLLYIGGMHNYAADCFAALDTWKGFDLTWDKPVRAVI